MRKPPKDPEDWAREHAQARLHLHTSTRRHILPRGECPYCDRERTAAEQHNRNPNTTFMPPHDPSRYCKSGSHPHCTCDTCF